MEALQKSVMKGFTSESVQLVYIDPNQEMQTCILINWIQDISSSTTLEQICIKYNYIIFTGDANTQYKTIVTKWHQCETN